MRNVTLLLSFVLILFLVLREGPFIPEIKPKMSGNTMKLFSKVISILTLSPIQGDKCCGYLMGGGQGSCSYLTLPRTSQQNYLTCDFFPSLCDFMFYYF